MHALEDQVRAIMDPQERPAVKWDDSRSSTVSPKGLCPDCRQMIQVEEAVDLYHRTCDHQNIHLGNVVSLHPNCYCEEHYAPGCTTASSRSAQDVSHA